MPGFTVSQGLHQTARRGLRVSKPTVQPFSPYDLDLIRAYDPDDLATGSVSTFPGHNGIGPTLGGGTGLTVVAGELNGHKVVRFVNQYVEANGGTSINGTTSWTLAAVFKTTTTNGGVLFHLGIDSARLSTNDESILVVPDDTVSGELHTTLGAAPIDTWHVAIWRYDGTAGSNATRLRCRLNGSDLSLLGSGTIPASISCADGTNLGRYGASGPYEFAGDMAWLALSADCESDDTTTAWDDWLVSRFAL